MYALLYHVGVMFTSLDKRFCGSMTSSLWNAWWGKVLWCEWHLTGISAPLVQMRQLCVHMNVLWLVHCVTDEQETWQTSLWLANGRGLHRRDDSRVAVNITGSDWYFSQVVQAGLPRSWDGCCCLSCVTEKSIFSLPDVVKSYGKC